MTRVPPTLYSTVSSQFIDDWLMSLRALCPAAQYDALLARAGFVLDQRQSNGRDTLDQSVRL